MLNIKIIRFQWIYVLYDLYEDISWSIVAIDIGGELFLINYQTRARLLWSFLSFSTAYTSRKWKYFQVSYKVAFVIKQKTWIRSVYNFRTIHLKSNAIKIVRANIMN